MTTVRRDRAWKAGILAASVAGHVAFFVILGLDSPAVREKLFRDEDEDVVTVDLMRPTRPPPAPRREARIAPAPLPSPVRPRQVRAPVPSNIVPLPMAPAPRPSPAPAPPTGAGSGGAAAGIGTGPPGGSLRDALRGSTVGCANRGAVGLNRRENEACDERLGAGAKDAPFIPAPMAAEKRGRFDARAAKLKRDRDWRERAPPVGIDPRAGPGEITGLDK